MRLTFGKHSERTVAEIVLKEPDYLLWMLAQRATTDPLAEACKEAKRLLRVFDRKPFLRDCSHEGCANKATRITVYVQSILSQFWCDDCDPYSEGANAGKLQVISTYGQAIEYVNLWCQGRKSDLKGLIRDMARAKGLPERVGAQQATAFFQP